MFSESTLKNLDSFRESYASARPFPHVAIDEFLEASFAEKLLRDFPVTDQAIATNEFNELGLKTVIADMRGISDAYRALCDFLVSDQFVGAIQEITGIEGLISLPNEAGGTHESRSGSVLAPHIDYNYFGERSPLHRRLNLLLYLNKDWDPAWGGNLQLHSNPRNWSENEIVTNAPIFNRCVIMETSEQSWHGFDRVAVPDDISRKSVSVYMFSEDRPEEEKAPRHSTFYVQPPIPDRFDAGFTLTEADARELRDAMEKRDKWIHFYQREALRQSGRVDQQKKRADWLARVLQESAELIGTDNVKGAREKLEKVLSFIRQNAETGSKKGD